MRVIIVDCDEEQIIAHNCEQAIRDQKTRMSAWLGTFDQFRRSFVPSSPIHSK
jgi:hypothetical protein